MKDRSLVRASDLAAWAYCQRAWFLAQVRQVPHQRPDVLERGVQAHRRHGQRVVQAARLQRAGWALAGAGMLLLLAGLALWLLR
ncbi:MAG: hypothetical protein DCC57_00455 [Chloroflexi bacterium]|nr:MAG: hypothetical protein DCC57_00455 [Chloroflexota bacterium]